MGGQCCTFEAGMWGVIGLIPDHCLSIYFPLLRIKRLKKTAFAIIIYLKYHFFPKELTFQNLFMVPM